MRIQNILFVTTFEDLSFDALQALLELRKTGLDHVVFLNVIEREKVAMRRGTGYNRQEEIKLREVANIRFIDWAESLFEQGMEVGVYIVVGSLVKQVVKSATNENSDLVVMGPRKTGKLKQFFAGSDLGDILRRTGKPLLVYRYVDERSGAVVHPFDTLVLAVGDVAPDQPSVRAVASLADIASTVHVVHVASEKTLTASSAMEIQRTRKEARQRLEDICDVLEAAGVSAEPHVYIGDPAAEIEKAAREFRATMVVLGVGGKGSGSVKRLGDVATAVAEDGSYPTLLVPPAGG
jgi:nucleotide-binding universal stress UspA family protein